LFLQKQSKREKLKKTLKIKARTIKLFVPIKTKQKGKAINTLKIKARTIKLFVPIKTKQKGKAKINPKKLKQGL
jgi:Holliday junction resolvase